MNLDGRQYDTVELFAGAARVSAAFRMIGRSSAALDDLYDGVVKRKGAMNIMTDAGFVSPGQRYSILLCAWDSIHSLLPFLIVGARVAEARHHQFAAS